MSTTPDLRHEITVALLRSLLNYLRPGDVLAPNNVNNLAVYRGGCYIGYISLLSPQQHIELFDDE